MKLFSILCTVSLFPLLAFGADEKNTTLTDTKQKVSYGIGVSIGKNMKAQGVEIEPDIFLKGFKDGLTTGAKLMTEEEITATLTQFQNELRTAMTAKQKVQGETNKKEGETFLAENKKKEGVKTLASGLQYKVIKEGTGTSPKSTDRVKTHYRGTLLDGTEFDSSYKRGEPATFPVNGVIAAWTEALQLMKPGSKWQLFVPSELAYKDFGSPPNIGPNATLIFEVELLGLEK